MATVEQFKELINRYYQRDDETKEQYEEFIASEHAALSLKKLYESILQIEKTFNHTLPQEYINFIEADYAWGIDGKENDFRLYDVKEIYDFNYIGNHRGNSSIEEMKDYFIFGQDDGECSYFFDLFNKLGYGPDTVWKINRGFVDNKNTWFDLISENFFDFIQACIEKKDIDSNYVFYSESNEYDFTSKNYVTYLAKECETIFEHSGNKQNDFNQIKNYLNIITAKFNDCYFEDFNDDHFIFVKENEEEFFKNAALTNLLYVIINTHFVILDSKKIRFLFLTSNILKKHNSTFWKKKFFVFACNEHSVLSANPLSWDLFFIDPTDKLGNGSNAIYMINENSKKIEDACYVAKDIVDLFRIFAEGEEINTTPIGKK
ncbi:MAG: SMI1/KNR4 family protein [Spirochaetales bacterium]|nr:SMI1/KNR4 family protein [Spirochaetales bacterium]